jgi:hypothetical protein
MQLAFQCTVLTYLRLIRSEVPSDILNLQLKALKNARNCVCSEKFPKVSLNDVIGLCSLSVASHVSDIRV